MSRLGKTIAVRVSVMLEVISGDVAPALVKGGVVIRILRKELELAISRGGVRVPCPAGKGGPSVRGCFGCLDRGHMQWFCPRWDPMRTRRDTTQRCYSCGGLGHRMFECHGRSLLVTGADVSFPLGLFDEGNKCSDGYLGRVPAGRGGALGGGSIL